MIELSGGRQLYLLTSDVRRRASEASIELWLVALRGQMQSVIDPSVIIQYSVWNPENICSEKKKEIRSYIFHRFNVRKTDALKLQQKESMWRGEIITVISKENNFSLVLLFHPHCSYQPQEEIGQKQSVNSALGLLPLLLLGQFFSHKMEDLSICVSPPNMRAINFSAFLLLLLLFLHEPHIHHYSTTPGSWPH